MAPFRDIAPVDHFVRLFGIAVRWLASAIYDLLTTQEHPSHTELERSVMTDTSMAPDTAPGAILFLETRRKASISTAPDHPSNGRGSPEKNQGEPGERVRAIIVAPAK